MKTAQVRPGHNCQLAHAARRCAVTPATCLPARLPACPPGRPWPGAPPAQGPHLRSVNNLHTPANNPALLAIHVPAAILSSVDRCTYRRVLSEDGAEVTNCEGPVSDVQLSRPFRRRFVGVRFFPFFRFQLVEHALYAEEALSRRLCFSVHPLHTASSWCCHMLVRVLQ